MSPGVLSAARRSQKDKCSRACSPGGGHGGSQRDCASTLVCGAPSGLRVPVPTSHGLCSSIQGRAGAEETASVSSFLLVCLGPGLPCSTLKLPEGVRIEYTRTRIQGITEGAWDPFGAGGRGSRMVPFRAGEQMEICQPRNAAALI